MSEILAMTQNARNDVICDVDSNSSFQTDDHKKYFLVLGERDTFGINGSFGAPKEKFSINFSKAKTLQWW